MSALDHEKYGKKGFMAFLNPYNDYMPEVIFPELSAANSFVLFYPAGISTFKNVEEASQFLIKELNFNEGLMEEACVNVLAPQKLRN